MQKSLLSFIWTHSKRDQLVLIAATLALFPLLYLTLELPKRIINDAIGAQADLITLWGVELSQTTFLVGLCLAFLAAVILHGLLKMRVNTMKGVVAERLLRRFRYSLIGRVLRFPRSYQQQTSEGELVAALTGEAEPLGGIMGDAIANPLLQIGQMATILLFLFLQNPWFGLAAIAIIPLQAWIIPRLQRQINLLNRDRIRQVRLLATDIGELSNGAATLRQNTGWRRRMQAVSLRLGRLFETRFDIYRKKFFMKFLNNLLTQITPFFFFLVGGLLVIEGQLTIGALVASLAAFKDLSNPWKELLTYYTTVQEVSQRYLMIIERFIPPGILPDFLAEPPAVAEATPSAALSLNSVVVQDEDGRVLLNEVSLDVAPGEWICLVVPADDARAALAQLLLRDVTPMSGAVHVGGQSLAAAGQYHIARQIGRVGTAPYIFQGTLDDNVMMALTSTLAAAPLPPMAELEAQRSGTADPHAAATSPEPGVLEAAAADWRRLAARIGVEKILLARALDRVLTPFDTAETLQEALVALRPTLRKDLADQGFAGDIQPFAMDTYLDDLTLAENLLFALKGKQDWIGARLSTTLRALLVETGLRSLVLVQSLTLARTLIDTFDAGSTGSVLFRRLGLPDDILPKLKKLLDRYGDGEDAVPRLKPADEQLLLIVVFNVPASAFDRAFSDAVKEAVVAARARAIAIDDPVVRARFNPLSDSTWNGAAPVISNLIFGHLKPGSRRNSEKIQAAVVRTLQRHVDPMLLFDLVRHMPTGLRGTNLTPQIIEHISLAQVLVKKPAVVILDGALASFAPADRNAGLALLREAMPDALIVQLESTPPDTAFHDRLLEMRNGRLAAAVGVHEDAPDTEQETSDMQKKLAALRRSPLFRELTRQQLRLLAFSARWSDWAEDDVVFHKNDAPDGAFLIYSGAVRLSDTDASGKEIFSVIPPEGTLVGELGLIRNDPRRLTMTVTEPTTLLRIDAEDFLSILENDARTAFKLIQHLIGYLDAGR